MVFLLKAISLYSTCSDCTENAVMRSNNIWNLKLSDTVNTQINLCNQTNIPGSSFLNQNSNIPSAKRNTPIRLNRFPVWSDSILFSQAVRYLFMQPNHSVFLSKI